MTPSVFPILRNVWGTTLSRGRGYEPHPPGRAFARDRVAGYFLDFTSKTVSAAASEPESLSPAAIAQIALGAWERILRGNAAAADIFDRACRALELRAVSVGREARWTYAVSVPKYGLRPGWSSALAQGQIASVFVRAYLAGGDVRHADLALAAIEPLLVETETDLVTPTARGPVLQEAPSAPASNILNGWIYALWGLWDVGVGLGDARAEAAFAASAACLTRSIDDYDTGWWSRYSTYPHRLDDLAKPFYHRLHVAQLEILHRLTGDAELLRTARRWSGYDRAPNRARALSQKGAFVLRGRGIR